MNASMRPSRVFGPSNSTALSSSCCSDSRSAISMGVTSDSASRYATRSAARYESETSAENQACTSRGRTASRVYKIELGFPGGSRLGSGKTYGGYVAIMISSSPWYIRARLRTRHLLLLTAIGEEGNIHKAAELLNMSQSAA